MEAHHITNEIGLPTKEGKIQGQIRVVIVYSDVPAGKHAMDVLTALGRRLGERVDFQPFPWSFELLSDAAWGEIAASEAVDADILIMASSGSSALPTAVGRWAQQTFYRKKGTCAAVVALFGTPERPDAGSARLFAIREAARAAGLEFFAPAPLGTKDDIFEALHHRAAEITPVLDDILRQCGPSLLPKNSQDSPMAE